MASIRIDSPVGRGLGLLVACMLAAAAPGCHRPSGGRVHDQALTVHQGEGWAVRVPEGAQVRTDGGSVAVDAPDGRRWFDVSWHPVEQTPESLVYAWGTKNCAPMMWDQPAEPVPGTWTSGGQCTVSDRRYYALVAVETFDEQRLFTAYLVEHRRLTYEDAWVDYVGTALTLRAGAEPLAAPDHTDLRARIREAAALPPGSMPIPGGGLLSGRISERVPELWKARRASPPPKAWTQP